MKIRDHRLTRDDGEAGAYVASPHAGGVIRPRFLVIHYTAGSSAAGTISWLRSPASRVSAHLVIARDGTVTRMVPFNREAWHAGQSRRGSLSGLNHHSIGIELDNAGLLIRSGGKWVSPLTRRNYPDSEVTVAPHKNDPPGSAPSGWHAYTPQQIEATLACGMALVPYYELADVLGHDDIAPGRKRDPGPDFPLESVRARSWARRRSPRALPHHRAAVCEKRAGSRFHRPAGHAPAAWYRGRGAGEERPVVAGRRDRRGQRRDGHRRLESQQIPGSGRCLTRPH